MTDEIVLRDVCEALWKSCIPDVQSACEYSWFGKSSDQMYEVIKRAAVVRQHEALRSIIDLEERGLAHFSVTLLRPAYEELLWIEYLEQNKKYALDLVTLLARIEIRDSLLAQDDQLGEKDMRSIGFSRAKLRKLTKSLEDCDLKLKLIGQQLQWRSGQTRPSIAFIARKVKREKQYKYLYQGTSRSVHFSPHELTRRVWGTHGKVTIGSASFSRYWSDFSLSWAGRILVETMIATGQAGQLSEVDGTGQKRFVKILNDLRPVQILTASELEQWDEPALNHNLLGK
jgi:hypothetical protein